VRDPNRIPQVLGVINGVWNQAPDLRLGQLLLNALPPGKELFYVEDDILLQGLKDLAKQMQNSHRDAVALPDKRAEDTAIAGVLQMIQSIGVPQE